MEECKLCKSELNKDHDKLTCIQCQICNMHKNLGDIMDVITRSYDLLSSRLDDIENRYN